MRREDQERGERILIHATVHLRRQYINDLSNDRIIYSHVETERKK